MTNEELKEIEDYAKWSETEDAWFRVIEKHVPALVAEVRRLKGLIKDAEFVLHLSPGYEASECPWCMGINSHDDECPAFTPNGEVK